MNVRNILLGIIALLAYWQLTAEEPPPPQPDVVPVLSLRGKFMGDFAVDDAVVMAEMCRELADQIEWDGKLESPRLTTGAALDDLRRTTREFRMRGTSIGARQPLVRDAVEEFLNDRLGRGGGPIDAEQRRLWIEALKDLAVSCRDAVGQ